jgi:hypothetical protein
LLIQPLKSPKNVLPNHTTGQKLYKRIPFSCHTCSLPFLWHKFDNCLCNFLQSIKFHVVCTCTFFGDTICLLTNRKMIKMVTLIDLHDCCILIFNIWVSRALEMTINFYYPTLELFVFHLPNLLLTYNFVYPTLFSSVPPPTPPECSLGFISRSGFLQMFLKLSSRQIR